MKLYVNQKEMGWMPGIVLHDLCATGTWGSREGWCAKGQHTKGNRALNWVR